MLCRGRNWSSEGRREIPYSAFVIDWSWYTWDIMKKYALYTIASLLYSLWKSVCHCCISSMYKLSLDWKTVCTYLLQFSFLDSWYTTCMEYIHSFASITEIPLMVFLWIHSLRVLQNTLNIKTEVITPENQVAMESNSLLWCLFLWVSRIFICIQDERIIWYEWWSCICLKNSLWCFCLDLYVTFIHLQLTFINIGTPHSWSDGFM